jgi:hypothetical protein
MKPKYFLSLILALASTLFLSGPAWAQGAGTVSEAFQTAKAAVSPALQTKVVSVYGIGTPAAIQKWYFIFYDPSVSTNGRAVLVENHQITKTYPANGGVTYSSSLTFDPSRITDEGAALQAAQNYAAKHAIGYDSVTALLHQTSANKPFRWKIGLLNGGEKKGYVYVNAIDDTVASFDPPTGAAKHAATGTADASAEGFANDVKDTFLGIGGDLQQFFTGERTVDR